MGYALADDRVKNRGLGGRLIAILRGMMDVSECLSLTIGERGHAVVVGHVGGDRRSCIYLWSGERQITVHDHQIHNVETYPDRVVVSGSFDGGVMTFRHYFRNKTRGMIAAERVGGEAGWLCDAIKRLQDTAEPNQCVWVTMDGWEGDRRKLQWFEYDERNGEVVLLTGRLDMLRQVRLRSDRLGQAKVGDDEIEAEAPWGQFARLWLGHRVGAGRS